MRALASSTDQSRLPGGLKLGIGHRPLHELGPADSRFRGSRAGHCESPGSQTADVLRNRERRLEGVLPGADGLPRRHSQVEHVAGTLNHRAGGAHEEVGGYPDGTALIQRRPRRLHRGADTDDRRGEGFGPVLFLAVRINEFQRVAAGIGVTVPTLRILRSSVKAVRAQEAAQASDVTSRVVIVAVACEARACSAFGVELHRGEAQSLETGLRRNGVSVRPVAPGLDGIAGDVGHQPGRAQVIRGIEGPDRAAAADRRVGVRQNQRISQEDVVARDGGVGILGRRAFSFVADRVEPGARRRNLGNPLAAAVVDV